MALFLVLGWMAAPLPDRVIPLLGKQPPQRILSLRLTADHVFVTTAEGLYRARLDKKHWEPLKGKTVPEPGGLFVTGNPEHKALLYFVTPQGRSKAADWNKIKNPDRPGLYRSKDLGDTWELLSNAHDFQQMARVPGGRLFALAVAEKDKVRQYVVLVSENGGRRWKDITNGVNVGHPLLFLIRDPDHTRRICLYSAFTRRTGGIILQSANDQFRWQPVYRSLRADHEWPPDGKKTEEEFFYHWYYVGYHVRWPAGTVQQLPEEFPTETFGKDGTGVGTSAMIYARLDNYFRLPFRDEKGISGFDIVPEKAAYEFAANQPVAVNVSLIRYTDGPPLRLHPRLVDAKNAKIFWSLKVSGPGEQKKDLWPKDWQSPFANLKNDQKLADLLKKYDAREFLLTPDKPLRRVINLRDLGMPDKPGTYRVQLRYTCSWCDDRGIFRSLATVTGQVFAVTIRADNQKAK
jgi:hypothetical protein